MDLLGRAKPNAAGFFRRSLLLGLVSAFLFSIPGMGWAEPQASPRKSCVSGFLRSFLPSGKHTGKKSVPMEKQVADFLKLPKLKNKQRQAISEAINLNPPLGGFISRVDAGRQQTILLSTGFSSDQIANLRLGGYLSPLEPVQGAVAVSGMSMKALPLGELDSDTFAGLLKNGRKLQKLRQREHALLKHPSTKNKQELEILRKQIDEIEPELQLRYYAGRNGIKITGSSSPLPPENELWVLRNSSVPTEESFVVSEAGILQYDPAKKQIHHLREYGAGPEDEDFAKLADAFEREHPDIKLSRQAPGKADDFGFKSLSLDCTQRMHRDMHGYGMLRDAFIARNVVDGGVRAILETGKVWTKAPHFWNTPAGLSTFILDTTFGQIMTGASGQIAKVTALGGGGPAKALFWRLSIAQGLKSGIQDPFFTGGLMLLPPMLAPLFKKEAQEEDAQKQPPPAATPAPEQASNRISPQDIADFLIYGTATDPYTRANNAYGEKFVVGGTIWGYFFDMAVLNQMMSHFYRACLGGKLTRIVLNPTSVRLYNGAALTTLYFGFRPTPEEFEDQQVSETTK